MTPVVMLTLLMILAGMGCSDSSGHKKPGSPNPSMDAPADTWLNPIPENAYSGFSRLPPERFAPVVESKQEEAKQLLLDKASRALTEHETQSFSGGALAAPKAPKNGMVFVLLRGVEAEKD